MKLRSIEIRNYRCFEHLDLQLDGESLVMVGPNAAGKSSILSATSLALVGGEVSRADLRDPEEAVEITATLTDIAPTEQGDFADAMDFNESPPVLRMTMQAIWDPHEQQVQQSHVFPDDGLRAVPRKAREAIRLLSLPAWRDPARLLSLLGRRSILAGLIDALPLDAEMEEAIAALSAAGADLSQAEPLRELMAKGQAQLARLLPGIPNDAYSIGSLAREPADVLRQLQLQLALSGQRLPVTAQSSGLGQASVFAFALEALAALPDAIVLVDEPERALHPQAQRALLARLQANGVQGLVATHSAAVLDRRDPRMAARLRPDAGAGAELFRAGEIDAADAGTLSRYSTSLIAEAYFAETVIFVEGFSDFLAVRTLAETLEVDLDAAGVSLLSLEGADLLKHYLALLGLEGLNVRMRGLCDLDKEAEWTRLLNDAGLSIGDRADLNAAGFQVAEADLEAELLSVLGLQVVEAEIAEAGAAGKLETFKQQPTNAGLEGEELVLAFIRKRKIKWAPLLAAAIAPTDVPTPIAQLLEGL
jgi:putative AbiEii toxin of type IV toxin-antitoxin system/OLD-like protein